MHLGRWWACTALLLGGCGAKAEHVEGGPVLPQIDMEFAGDPGIQGACLTEAPRGDDAPDCVIVEVLDDAADCGPGRLSFEGGICLFCLRGDGVERTHDTLGNDVEECAQYAESGDFVEYLDPRESPDECPTTGKLAFQGAGNPQLGSVVRVGCD